MNPNPHYAGAFCYGRRSERLAGGKYTYRPLPRDEWTVLMSGLD